MRTKGYRTYPEHSKFLPTCQEDARLAASLVRHRLAMRMDTDLGGGRAPPERRVNARPRFPWLGARAWSNTQDVHARLYRIIDLSPARLGGSLSLARGQFGKDGHVTVISQQMTLTGTRDCRQRGQGANLDYGPRL